ncbi:SurA N-terminal domain-containing protein [Ancylobacter sp. MQZ15Z-1]|uniref:Parvulin-like PPIase n=1 Tax=Ancylobacter mangrovi TaxID=2972472 RepID=A0A9X2PE97_9HYPH|nr:SurA N-terminal domain-containing protein [Ancylobacter mangrovi]MCS0497099.1 SurA N-terminal domain-containing protein [Ancylobacter mangrovi]
MLQTLRKSASGLIAKILMALLIVSFGVWGIADVFRGFGSQTLATIGDTEITVPEFRQIYQDRLQRLSQQLKRGISPDQARALGIPDQVLNERLAEAALDDEANRLGLALSDSEIARRVQENPAYFGPSGAFDPAYFDRLLRANNFTEARFVDTERRFALRQQLIQSLGGGIEVPQVMKDAVARYQNEERSVNYAMLTKASLPALAAPSDADLQAFFDKRKVAFKAPEFRKIEVLALTPQALVAAQKVTDAEVKADYDANLASYGTPERRDVQQIVFPNEDEAKAAAARIEAGTSFADIAAERKLSAKDIDIGTVAKTDIVDPAIADAAFALPADGTSGVIEGRFGPVIVHVGTITPSNIQPLSEVADQIRAKLQMDAAARAVGLKYDDIEDDRASGAQLSEIASKIGVPLVTIETDADGRTPDNQPVASIPGRAEVLRGAFAADVGADNDPIRLPQNAAQPGAQPSGQPGGYVWYVVDSVTPPADRTFEQAKPLVLERWKDDKTAEELDKKVEDIKAKVAAGTSFDIAVTDAGLELRAANGLKRGRAADGIPQEILDAVFDTPKGDVGSAMAEGGDSRILFKVLNVDIPAGAKPDEKLVSDIRQGMENDLMTEYLVALQSELGARINRTALDQIVGADAVD